MTKDIAVLWAGGRQKGSVAVLNGTLDGLSVTGGEGAVTGNSFSLAPPSRLRMRITEPDPNVGSAGAVATIHTAHPFSLYVRDVSSEYPILIEETYDVAAAHTRSLVCPIWLGLSRDFRIFEVAIRNGQERGERVCPRFHGYGVGLPESDNNPVSYNFVMGRGQGCVHDVSRRLEEGVLPILHGTLSDEDMAYDFTAFVTLESSKLTLENLQGTHFLVADRHGPGHMQTPEQTRLYESLLSAEMERDEETVLFFRAKGVNRGRVPRYAWFKNISPSAKDVQNRSCLLYTSPSPRDATLSRMPSSA